MCVTTAFKYEAFANNQKLPQALRDTALLQIDTQKQMQETFASAISTVPPPAGGNKRFSCTIYSLENKSFRENMTQSQQQAVTNPREVTNIPGVKVQDSAGFNNASQDVARQRAFDGLKHVYQFYKDVFGRESIDGQGLEIRASIHYSRGIDNGFWSSNHNQMVFGDGGRFDGRGWLLPSEKEIKDDLEQRDYDTLSEWSDNYDIDIIGHELTHGVVQFTAGLGDKIYDGPAKYSEAATLNEHVADSFAIALKHWVNRQNSQSGNWDFSPNVWTQLAMQTQGWNEKLLPHLPSDPGQVCRYWAETLERPHRLEQKESR